MAASHVTASIVRTPTSWLRRNLVPVAPPERLAYGRGGVADPLEAVEDVRVTVDVALGDLPVVGARVAGRPRIGEDDPAFELGSVDVQGNAVDAVGNDLVFRDRTAAPTLMIGRMTVAGA